MTSDMSDVIRFISDRIGDYDKPEYLNKWAEKAMKELPSFRYSMSSRDLGRRRWKRKAKSLSDKIGRVLNKVEKVEGFSLMEKLQLAFIFSRSVSDEFVQMLKNAKFEINQDEKKRIRRFSTEDGSIFRFSDHNPNFKYFEGVLCMNGFSDRIKREKEQDHQDVEYDNPGPEITERAEPMEEMQEEIDEEVIEDPTEDIPEELKPKQEVDDYSDFGEDFRQGAFNGHIDYEDLDAQQFDYPGFPQTARPETSIRVQKRRQSSSTDRGKRAKTDSIETSSNQNGSMPLEAAPANALSTIETTSRITTPDEPKINVLSLVTHIETIAMYYDLENLEKKASLAIKKMKDSEENKTLSVKKFSYLIIASLISIEENRIRQTESSISLKSILKHLKLFLIRPLGSEEAMEFISRKIREFENEDYGVPPNLFSDSLTSLMIATGFYNQLE
ncbi:unnamed protein product [Caenorhabditis nigoni]